MGFVDDAVPAESLPEGVSRRQFMTRSVTAVAGAAIAPYLLHASERQAGTPGQAHRIIIDADPGVDDALAILLAAASPELRIEGITPVAGNVPLELTLPNALRLVEIAGRTDIPVAAGANRPLTRKLITAAYAHGENGLGGVQFPEPRTKPVSETASQLIRRVVRAHPGEVTIVAIGPLTNLAVAFREDHDLPHMVRSIYMMGGSLSRGNVTPSAEFNIYVDPEAAQEVFHAGIPIVMVGLDVTRKAVLRDEHIKRLEAASNQSAQAAGKITRAIWNRMQRSNFAGGPVMHDSVAVAALLHPATVKLQDYYVEVETAGEFTAGETLGYSRALIRRSAPPADGVAKPELSEFKPNAKVAMDLDADRFFELLVGRLTTARAPSA
jgi:pyrimidine-specific ribonucleoside hydrolase